MTETIAIAADHGGFEMKSLLVKDLEAAGYKVLDLGTNSPESVDYPDFAHALAVALKEGRAARGVLLCGSGIGISIAANRHRHIRAALVHDETGARLIGIEVARAALKVFLTTSFEGGRHEKRVAKLG